MTIVGIFNVDGDAAPANNLSACQNHPPNHQVHGITVRNAGKILQEFRQRFSLQTTRFTGSQDSVPVLLAAHAFNFLFDSPLLERDDEIKEDLDAVGGEDDESNGGSCGHELSKESLDLSPPQRSSTPPTTSNNEGSATLALRPQDRSKEDVRRLSEMLKSSHTLRNLPGTYREALCRIAQLRQMHRGDVVYDRGDVPDGLYMVVDGTVDIVLGPELGRETGLHKGVESKAGETLSRAMVGHAFGEAALMNAGARSSRAIVSSEFSSLMHIPVEDYRLVIGAIEAEEIFRALLCDRSARTDADVDILDKAMLHIDLGFDSMGSLPTTVRHSLCKEMTCRYVGNYHEFLFKAKEPSEGLYIVVTGRVKASNRHLSWAYQRKSARRAGLGVDDSKKPKDGENSFGEGELSRSFERSFDWGDGGIDLSVLEEVHEMLGEGESFGDFSKDGAVGKYARMEQAGYVAMLPRGIYNRVVGAYGDKELEGKQAFLRAALKLKQHVASDVAQRLFQIFTLRVLHPGEVIAKQNTPVDEIFVVESGSCSVSVDVRMVVAPGFQHSTPNLPENEVGTTALQNRKRRSALKRIKLADALVMECAGLLDAWLRGPKTWSATYKAAPNTRVLQASVNKVLPLLDRCVRNLKHLLLLKANARADGVQRGLATLAAQGFIPASSEDEFLERLTEEPQYLTQAQAVKEETKQINESKPVIRFVGLKFLEESMRKARMEHASRAFRFQLAEVTGVVVSQAAQTSRGKLETTDQMVAQQFPPPPLSARELSSRGLNSARFSDSRPGWLSPRTPKSAMRGYTSNYVQGGSANHILQQRPEAPQMSWSKVYGNSHTASERTKKIKFKHRKSNHELEYRAPHETQRATLLHQGDYREVPRDDLDGEESHHRLRLPVLY